MPLTEKNLTVLRMLVEIQDESGWQPTARELAARLGQASPGPIQWHINKLVKAGFVERRGARRAVTVAGRARLRFEELTT